ncbi:SNF1-related protein kinase regulatory subunit gamma-1 isoform X2 [Ziziphus jujuba]|uniref:SNF1-related protein kinase regulatory subunit gamma-1 isoform X2 n=1 Tax=Ziziphus jujuba TaxID=326968 RepID=A0ABM3IVN2_ZIZJJ|nr:SNF1-related protein kinase regulatory subunit gamma-1 isoform X2 [Ziziphus jujuba]
MENIMKKDTPSSTISTHQSNQNFDSGTALQLFFDHIPISSIPGIRNSPVLELKTGDCVRDAISLLYEKNAFGALVADNATDEFSECYIGFIDFASMVLWCLEEFEKVRYHNRHRHKGTEETDHIAPFFSILERYPHIGHTKIGELAKSFLLDPFFPVNLDDTLFHVLLLLSKHRLQVVPVIEQPNSQVIGFITQNAVMQFLLQSSGLDWFDRIADKALTDFWFEHKEHAVHVYGDQSITEALHTLWKNRTGVIAVTDRESKRLIGSVRNSDVYLLLESENLLHDKKTTVEEFIHMESHNGASDLNVEQDLGILLSKEILLLRKYFLPKMTLPVTNKETDTLRQAMKNMSDTKSSFSLLVDDTQQATGLLTLRDIIIQFAPPCIDSGIHGVGFFEFALEQAGCHVNNGHVICDR